jgi:hypothetical protein
MVPCVPAEKRFVERDGGIAKVGRAAKFGRPAKDDCEKAGWLKVIRGVEKELRAKLPNPPRPKAKSSVETRQELPSAANAVIATIEVRVTVGAPSADSRPSSWSPYHSGGFSVSAARLVLDQGLSNPDATLDQIIRSSRASAGLRLRGTTAPFVLEDAMN